MVLTVYESVKMEKSFCASDLSAFYETCGKQVFNARFNALLLIFALGFLILSATSSRAIAQITVGGGPNDSISTTTGTVVDTEPGSLTITTEPTGWDMVLQAPPGNDSTVLSPTFDRQTMGLLNQVETGDRLKIYWRAEIGRRVPVGFERLTRTAIADQQARPEIADETLIPRRLLTDRGGMFDLMEKADYTMLVYDRLNNTVTGERDLYRMYGDGRLPLCITCFSSPRPRAIMGNPAWHPDGRHVVFQRVNARAERARINALDWGIDNDLWLLDTETREMQPIWQSPEAGAALNPRFEGKNRLIFSQRLPSGDKQAGLSVLIPGSRNENVWQGWQIVGLPLQLRNGKFTTGRPQKLFERDGKRLELWSRQSGYLLTMPAEDERAMTGAYSQHGDPRIIERILDHGNASIGPVLQDRDLTVYASTRSAFSGTRIGDPEKKPQDLFIDLPDGRLLQLTDHKQRSRKDGVIYRIADLGWTKDHQTLYVTISAANPITGREKESEIWRYNLAPLMASLKAPAGATTDTAAATATDRPVAGQ